jgi:hypothetical protein
MPQLIIRGMKKEHIQAISKTMVDELTSIVGCPRDYFTIELLESRFIQDGLEVTGSPLIQVNWFDRGQTVQDAAAQAIDRAVRSAGYEQIEIFFVVLDEARYYENGKHY